MTHAIVGEKQHGEKRRGHMKMEAEIGVMWPPDKGCSEISEAGREEFLLDLSVCVWGSCPATLVFEFWPSEP